MKINIENYENMTPEEKLAAWESFDPEKNGFVSKATFDKKASEASDLNKQLKARMTDDEAKAAKDAEEREALLARVQELELKETVGNYTNAYLGMGYDEKLAKSSAEAIAKGDMNTVFANQKTYMENREKNLRAELLKETPAPTPGSDGGAMTIEKLRAMTPKERYDYSVNNPEEYKTLYGGN